MIRPLRPCKPGCPGWRVAWAGSFRLVQRCEACWTSEVLKPTRRYYQQQPECRLALAKEISNAQTR